MSVAEQLPFIIITLLSVASAIGFALWVNWRDRCHKD